MKIANVSRVIRIVFSLTFLILFLDACAPSVGDGLKSSAIQADSGEQIDSQKPADPACVAKAVSALKQYSPSGYQTWARVQDKSMFDQYLSSCAHASYFYLYEIPTAVHESNHYIRSLTEAYHLLSDEMLPVPPTPQYFAPREMAQDLGKILGKQDDYFDIYIAPNQEKASSKDDFTYLLDEMNAYTNDTRVTEDMYKVVPYDNNRQAGLPAMMTFVAYYAKYASLHHPEVYEHLSENLIMRSALTKLWDQAEQTLLHSCEAHPESWIDTSYYVRFLCDTQQTSALAAALGRAPKCPSQCKSSEASGAVRTVRHRASFSFETR